MSGKYYYILTVSTQFEEIPKERKWRLSHPLHIQLAYFIIRKLVVKHFSQLLSLYGLTVKKRFLLG
jgi:hypothetical protein